MSSDSEYDEFYDAEENTSKPVLLKNIPDSPQLSDSLAEEERKLLELKRKQEERRRKEDEEYRQMLLELEEKKRREKKQEEEKRLKEDEKRRRKLESMRQKISNENLSIERESATEEEDEVDSSRDFDSDSSNDASETLIQSEVTKRLTFSENMDSSYPDKAKVVKEMPVLVGHDYPDDSRRKSGSEEIVDKLLQDNKVCGSHDLSNDPDLEMDNEPDIVRSTKTRTPPNTLASIPTSSEATVRSSSHNPKSLTLPLPGSLTHTAQPKAPPRRKRKDQHHKELESEAPNFDDFEQRKSSLPSPTSDFGVNMDGYSLDIRSCLGGRRHIRTEEAEIHAVNSDLDSPHHGTSSTSSSLGRTESKTKSDSLETKSRHSSSAPSQGRGHGKAGSLGRSESKSASSSLGRSSSSSAARSESKSASSSLGRSESRSHKSDDGHSQSKKSSSLPRKSSNVSRKSIERERRKSGEREKRSSKESSRCSSPNSVETEETPATRPRSNSGRLLTDEEILESVLVLNLDTGEKVPLLEAEDKIPKCVNPLTLHIMKITNEIDNEGRDTSETGAGGTDDSKSLSEEHGVKKKGLKLRKFLGKKMKKNVDKLRTAADQVIHGDENGIEEEVNIDGKLFKLKAHHKGAHEFNQLKMLQDMSNIHTGAVWTMKFSPCGKLLVTGGQDNMLRIWVLKSAFNHFDEMRMRFADVRMTPALSHESLNSIVSENSVGDFLSQPTVEDDKDAPFMSRPFCVYRGHLSDVLDVSWSKNYFILSSSMDKTVRLWHISRRECLCIFQHIDFVTAIVFHPKDDRYFLSGSLDGKLRLWNIPEKKVTMWNEVPSSSLITTANFCQNGKFAVAGTYDGKCIFYTTEHFKYYTQVHVRSTRGKNAKGSKITGIESLPGEDKILVTSNDSRIRLYDLRDLTLTCKYKGGTNNSSQIKASFSPKAKYIICGSEDHFVYIWKTQHEFYKFSSARRDRNDYWEAIKVHNATVTAAVFAPNPSLLIRSHKQEPAEASNETETQKQVLVTADFSGAIKVVLNRAPKVS